MFACACSVLGPVTMIDPLDSHGHLSRTERLEIISCVAAAEMGECSAWIVPMLEHSDLNEDQAMEQRKC